MSSPISCTRCSRLAPSVTPSGLCMECALTADTAAPTFRARPPVPPPAPPIEPPTASFLVPHEPSTAPAPPSSERPLPVAPPGHELIRRLGSGGMGEVYLARESTSERLVAMKFLKCPGDPSQFERFVVELRVLANLNHPNIVRVHSSDFMRADPYFTMEYVPGGSLARAPGPLPVAAAVELVRAVAVAVGAAHADGVIHRDLKPSNILIGFDGVPKVVDFGLAKRLDESDPVTVMSGALGTPGYMPPEQISRRNGKIGACSDVYGLGATLYHLLIGRAPFVGDTVADTISKVLAEPPERLRAVRPDVPPALEGIVLKCLEKSPDDRYESMGALIADLDDWAAGRKTVAPPLTVGRRLARWARRNRRRLVTTTAVVVAAAALLGVGAMLAPTPPKPPTPEVLPDEVRGSDGRLLPFRVRLGHDKSKVSVADDGTITISTWGMCLVEYVPDGPRPERYGLKADIRHERSDVGGRVGLYFAHQRLPGATDGTHVLGYMVYNDIRLMGDFLEGPAPVPLPTENSARFGGQIRSGARERPWSGLTEMASGEPFKPARRDRWRAVGVRVGPAAARGVWEGRDLPAVAPARFDAQLAVRLADGRRLRPDADLPEVVRFDPRAGCGLLVENGSASFRAFELIADKND